MPWARRCAALSRKLYETGCRLASGNMDGGMRHRGKRDPVRRGNAAGGREFDAGGAHPARGDPRGRARLRGRRRATASTYAPTVASCMCGASDMPGSLRPTPADSSGVSQLSMVFRSVHVFAAELMMYRMNLAARGVVCSVSHACRRATSLCRCVSWSLQGYVGARVCMRHW